MKRFSQSCGGYAESLCLLADDALPGPERAPVEHHLAGCGDCRKYYDEIRRVTAPLGDWEQCFAQLEPSQTAEARWAKDFELAIRPKRSPLMVLTQGILNWCHDMIWPCRRVWTGFAAAWLVILGINLSVRDKTPSLRPSPELVKAFLESEGILAQPARRNQSPVAEPPKPPSTPPRSERRPRIHPI